MMAFLLCILLKLPIYGYESTSVDIPFDGYYVEVLLKTETRSIKRGGFLIDSSRMNHFFKHLEYSNLLSDYKRLFDYSSYTFKKFNLQPPDSLKTYTQIDWNVHKSLSSSFDSLSCDKLVQIEGKTYLLLYIKRVSILYTPINSKTKNLSSQLDLDFDEKNNYLLKLIYNQRPCTINEILQFDSSINEIDISKITREWGEVCKN